MAARRRKETPSVREPFWYPDARERLCAFLPELALSFVAMTCMTTVMCYRNGMSIALLMAIAACIQLVVMTIMYVCTYLVRNQRWAYIVTFFLMTMIVPAYAMTMVALHPLFDVNGMNLSIPVSITAGSMLFFLTRTRAGLVFLLVEVLGLTISVDEVPVLWAIHVVGFAALATLLVMRSSATHITREAFVRDEPDAAEPHADDETHGFVLGTYGQIAAWGILTGMLCLALAFGGTTLMGWGRSTSAAATDASITGEQGIPGQDVMPEVVSDTDGSLASEQLEDGEADARGPAVSGACALALLLAALVLPVPARLLMRWWARRALECEPQTTDRAAKLYQAIIGRLSAAGIERDEAETPSEFLTRHADELEELTEPADLDLRAWIALTEVYEKVRYADLEPTRDELATCWKLYEALPACARAALGWRTYLTGAFWHM